LVNVDTEAFVTVIGAGLAGSEAAWQLAQRKVRVKLYEMRPTRMTAAHTSAGFAELVCSNSFGSDTLHSASRMLKDEITAMGSFVLQKARECAVPAGASLAVDRVKFSQVITAELEQNPYIEIIREECQTLPPSGVVILATGPLTSQGIAQELAALHGEKSLYFYDAISPIVSADSLDMNKMFFASRYDKGDPDFLNIPLTEAEYFHFVDELNKAEVVLAHDFEKELYFESCLPIETLASRGKLTLAFGPMKPVGLNHPKTGQRAFAVIQLRAENKFRTAYNLVGFQTKMKYKEQERLFRQLPGLEQAEFLRLGSMHRNTYIDSPRLLSPTLQLRSRPNIFVAGQLTGTEGYLESTSTGLLAGVNAWRSLTGQAPLSLPDHTMLGALLGAITDPARAPFQPMNVNFGVLPPLVPPVLKDKKRRNEMFALRAKSSLESFVLNQGYQAAI
jgi:methylenetetrahydrofolate--tRNA-(uracil-5-)-methyltransferase